MTGRSPHVVFFALSSVSVPATTAHASFLLERGVRVLVVTAEPVAFHEGGLDPRAELWDLTRGEAANAVFRMKQAVHRVPKVRALTNQGYKVLRPAVLWRAAERDVRRRLDLSDVDEIICADAHGVPLAWHLARRHPTLRVAFSLDRARYEDRPSQGGPREAAEV